MLSGGRRIEQQRKEASAATLSMRAKSESETQIKFKCIKDTPHHELRVSRGSNFGLRVCAPSGSSSLMALKEGERSPSF